MDDVKKFAKAFNQPTLKATPRSNSVVGFFADALKPVQQFASNYNIPQSIPLIGGQSVADITGLTGAQGLLEDVSYGAPVVRGGSFQTAQVDPRVLDVAGLVPTGVGMAKGAGMYGKSLAKEIGRNINEGTAIGNLFDPRMNMIAYHGSPLTQPTPKTKYELAHEIAQKNAVEMLGLPPDNTAMDRARALGFDVDNLTYHGTNKDVNAFNVDLATGKTYGTGAWLSDNPSVANSYTMGINGGNVLPVFTRRDASMMVDANNKNWNRLGKSTKVTAPKIQVKDIETDNLLAELGLANENLITRKPINKTLGKMFPDEFLYDDYFATDDLARYARNQGYDSASFNNVIDIGPSGMFVDEKSGLPSNNKVVFKPENIRSKFAAFDPARVNEADLLGHATPEMMGILSSATAGGIFAANKNKEKIKNNGKPVGAK